ncbi:hypothetical protein PM082_018435 [Marasmius tenuissimus]|nr:hypothetical protein PM082_018435 [Marasmius tenuissimus]
MGFERAIKIAKLAKTKSLSVHRSTLRKYMKRYNLESWRFSRISNRRLDEIVRGYRKEHPGSGLSYLMEHLRSHHGLRVQRHRILGILQECMASGLFFEGTKSLGAEDTRYHVRTRSGISKATTN